MMISTRKSSHITNWWTSYRRMRRMTPLSGVFGRSSDTKGHYFDLILTTRVLSSTSWLNGKMGRLWQSHYLS
jgi:hypothetical protein